MQRKHRFRLTSLLTLLFLATLLGSPWTQIGFARTSKPIPVTPVPVEDDAAVPLPTKPVVSSIKPPISGVVEEAASKPNPTTMPSITIQPGMSDEDQIRILGAKKVQSFPNLRKKTYTPYEVESVNLQGDWALLNLVSFPEEVEKDTHIVIPQVVLAVAERKKNGSWAVSLENEEEYANQIMRTPETHLGQDTKESFVSRNRTLQSLDATQVRSATVDANGYSTDEYHVPGLPFGVNESWRYNYGPHGSYSSSLDFGTPTKGQAAMVRAAEDGVITRAEETCIFVERYNSPGSLNLIYQHLNKDDVSKWRVGQTVKLGTALGMTTVSSGCGCVNCSTGHHVHLQMVSGAKWDTGISVAGKSLNGWVVEGGSLTKYNPETKVVDIVGIGGSVKHKDWVISRDILFPGQVTFPKEVDIIVRKPNKDTVVNFTVGSQAEINLDFQTNKMQIDAGNKMIVRSGGKVY